MAEILLPVSENKRPPYWNSTSGFDFDIFVVIIACHSVSAISNVIGIRAEIMGAARHGQEGALAPPPWKCANGYLLLLRIVR